MKTILLIRQVPADVAIGNGLRDRAVQRYMTRMARIALMPPKAMRCRPSETL